MEPRNSFDLERNLQAHTVLISLVLLLVSLHGGDLSLLVSGHAQVLLLEVNISQVLGDFNLFSHNFQRSGSGYVLPREAQSKLRGSVTRSSHCSDASGKLVSHQCGAL